MGSPFTMVVVGVESLSEATSFYDEIMGLDALWTGMLEGDGFTRHWGLPQGASAKGVLIGLEPEEYGRILLVECDGADGQVIRGPNTRSISGHYNLNFHVEDCFAAVGALRQKGIAFWSEPVKPDIDESQGGTVEALFDGPGGVAINLVELTGGGADTSIGQMRAQLANHAQSRTGFTPVATSTHAPKDGDPAVAFYRDVLGMNVVIDQVLGNPATNAMLGRPEDAQSRIVFLEAGHVFGKIVLSVPVNYDVEDGVPQAVLPNIGYIAQSYLVPDVPGAVAQTKDLGGSMFSDVLDLEIPGLGARNAAVVTCPGSGALIELIGA